ncbi:MerR family transcriptional regulator [Clostridium folliculivorans]|uniref:MerR family transcriptional regulator n=1 Tax=Clostridium folliculivorans TaxID=2886038 RepID=A0A9W6DC22_9CLOT|nr:MerR family transcriptional regulator [Clostridium folliculivorans]GKU26536.1 MerR family transcriptional regulator [Clostridium folliculivorans]GKU29032.1 MerR family transcriptional regulator [Clostridium folliculivorans]
MRDKHFYTAGEFAKKAGVTIRTIRFYDNKGLLKPSSLSEAGYRLYTDEDFAKLQVILTLKYLGFSLEDIAALVISEDSKIDSLKNSLDLQLEMVRNKINHLELIEKSIIEAKKVVEEDDPDWSKIVDIIHVTNMEKDLSTQYKDSRNLKVRINLHDKFSVNKYGWFNWIFDKICVCEKDKILEIGCGDGQLWKKSQNKIPESSEIVLSDISHGMLNDSKENLKELKANLKFHIVDCVNLPYEDESFDKVVANHMIFYVKDRKQAFSEIKRVLKKGGHFYCSTYGLKHMKEIETLTKSFDSRISLSEVHLEEIFGLENGKAQLIDYFPTMEKLIYEDKLIIDQYKPLLDYILSCHGNQHEILAGRYDEFEKYVKAKVEKTGIFKVSKYAGLFVCQK